MTEETCASRDLVTCDRINAGSGRGESHANEEGLFRALSSTGAAALLIPRLRWMVPQDDISPMAKSTSRLVMYGDFFIAEELLQSMSVIFDMLEAKRFIMFEYVL